MDLFRVRLNCIDHYQATPTRYDPQLHNDISPAQTGKGPKVPVIRVFGSTETGQKVCAHIHGAFPYMYVEYNGSLEPDEVGAFIYRIHLSIDHALAVSYRRDQYGGNAKYVARITLIKGVPFYGFHVGYRFFLKIYMLSPIAMTRLADLLQQGVIMKRVFQPYEAHLQYLLQFMTDYNLYGCDYLDASKTFFRAPVPSYAKEDNSRCLWHDRSIPVGHITDDFSLPRASHCAIEVDLCVQDIMNRKMVKERRLHHDFIERVKPLPADMKLVHSMAGLWKDETRRRKLKMPNAPPGSSPFAPEALVSMSAGSRRLKSQGWIHEKEYREEIERLIAAEKNPQSPTGQSFDSFLERNPMEARVQTAHESVEDLYPSNLMPALGLSMEAGTIDQNPASSIDVDEQTILDNHDILDLFPDDSDEERLVKIGNDGQGNATRSEQITAQSGRDKVPEAPRGGKTDTDSDVPVPIQRRTVNGLASHPVFFAYGGLSTSRLKTGNPPNVPICDELLAAAEEEELVSRTRGLPRSHQGMAPSLKRSASLPLSRTPAKRPRIHVPGPSTTILSRDKRNENISSQTSHRAVADPSPVLPSSKKSSGRVSNSSQGNQTLNFPVVKSQDDATHRLSQKDARRADEKQSAPSKKLVSFNPSARVTDGHKTLTTPVKQPPSPSTPSTLSIETRFHRVREAVAAVSDKKQFLLGGLPPLAPDVSSTLKDFRIPDVIYQDAYYSDEKDVPTKPREYAGREFQLESSTLPYLPEFDMSGASDASRGVKTDPKNDEATEEHQEQRESCSFRSWEIGRPPPSYRDVQDWWKKQQANTARRSSQTSRFPQNPGSRPYLSQIDGPTQNKYGFRYSQHKKSTSVKHEAQYMSTLSLEIHVNSRGKLVPNPDEDEVQCIFWAIKADDTASASQDASGGMVAGVIVLSPDNCLAETIRRQVSAEVIAESEELDLMVRMVEVVRTHDPDILTGYEVHGGSWGYLIERARLKYEYDLCDEFSRMKSNSHGRIGKENDQWGFNTTSSIRVTGRHMINVWRAMRGELNLVQYTMENVVWHLLHRRIPHYSWKTLTEWYVGGRQRDLNKLLRYYVARTKLDIEILEANELISRTSEQARLLGVDFFSVFSRGSQFKVESIMFRIAKPENFMLVSPSRKQVGGQNALECLPLVMEPQSAFYNSPLLVLDFQSLYPSVMIAYNLCYSTFLGRIVNWRGMNKMGFAEYKRHQQFLTLLRDHINIAPNGMMYVKAEIRKSLLAKMLTEILETRVMVKSGMKEDKDDKTLQQLLNNRQLALKLLANVTYGYTSASFSGRMPCSEIADSIVQTGRETLERAIAFIHSQERWGAEVVYGDTDSLFVYLKGRTRDQAFDIGNEISKAITDMNPRPVKLKFEKVYHPCVLLAKKRYVGYKYESRDQAVPDFDAKGIETVRRDGTPAEQKIEEKALKTLFETADLSRVKAYFQSQCDKIMRGAVSVQDFCFAKEVKLGSYSNKGPPPPGAHVSTKRMLEDARAEPQYGERVPYVVVAGAPGARLIDRCVAPEDLLRDSHAQLDAEYYISKNLIPPLERIFNLVGANVRQWYDEMPKVQRIRRLDQAGFGAGEGTKEAAAAAKKGGVVTTAAVAATRGWNGPAVTTGKTLESYMMSAWCLLCNVKMTVEGALCGRCRADAPASLLALQTRLTREEKRTRDVLRVCRSCAALPPLDDVPCDSKDCPVFYTRVKQGTRLRAERGLLEPVIRELGAEAARAALEW